jgi:hypothetical protein
VYKQGDDTNLAEHASYTVFLASGKQWRFQAWMFTNANLDLDDYKEFASGTVYPSVPG